MNNDNQDFSQVFFSRLRYFILQRATLTPFRTLIPAISHFDLLIFSPDMEENLSEVFMGSITKSLS